MNIFLSSVETIFIIQNAKNYKSSRAVYLVRVYILIYSFGLYVMRDLFLLLKMIVLLNAFWYFYISTGSVYIYVYDSDWKLNV